MPRAKYTTLIVIIWLFIVVTVTIGLHLLLEAELDWMEGIIGGFLTALGVVVNYVLKRFNDQDDRMKEHVIKVDSQVKELDYKINLNGSDDIKRHNDIKDMFNNLKTSLLTSFKEVQASNEELKATAEKLMDKIIDHK